MPNSRQVKYSEIFGGNLGSKPTFQGEGKYTGHPSVWVRFFGCNFSCRGFGQKDPGNPETYEFDYPDFDFDKIKTMEEVPIIKFGCDSAYSWASKFKHLAPTATVTEVADIVERHLNGGKFIHPKSGQDCHLVFTGGEPMLRAHQSSMAQLLQQFRSRNNTPVNVTIETNATQPSTTEFAEAFSYLAAPSTRLFWSCSPKLYTSGEKFEQAIRPEIIKDYASISNHGQLKYVVNGEDRSWEEVEKATDLYREAGVNWPVWIMPVGSDLAQQKHNAASISDEALRRGYNVASRVHVFVYGNEMGR